MAHVNAFFFFSSHDTDFTFNLKVYQSYSTEYFFIINYLLKSLRDAGGEREREKLLS